MMWRKNKTDPRTDGDVVKRDQALTADRKNYFMVGPPCFDQQQIERIKALVDADWQAAPVYSSDFYGGDNEIRRTKCRELDDRDAHTWLYEIITRVFTSANEQMRYDIAPAMNDPIEILRYDADDEGFFVWHADTMPFDMTRKMSVVVPLSDPQEFEGGKLQFLQNGAMAEVLQEPGRPVVFPSWLIHQVTPITGGRRYSLVAWIRGPNWR